MAESATSTRLVRVLQRVAPWVVAAAALAWLFHSVPFGRLTEAMARVNLPAFAAIVIVYIAGLLFLDTFATWATFRWALPDVPLSYRDVLDLRGASYLLAIIHYGAGQGGLGWFLHRKHGVALSRVAGTVMLIMGVNVVVVALCALLGVALGGAPDEPVVRWVVIALACGFPVYLAVIAAKPGFLAHRKLLAPLFEAGLRGHAVASAARIPHVLWLVVANWAVMRLFGVDPGFGRALALLPIVFVVAVLPISPSGLGTAQVVAVRLLAPFAPNGDPAAVLAYSLALQFASLFVQAGVGLFFLRKTERAAIVGEEPGPGT